MWLSVLQLMQLLQQQQHLKDSGWCIQLSLNARQIVRSRRKHRLLLMNLMCTYDLLPCMHVSLCSVMSCVLKLNIYLSTWFAQVLVFHLDLKLQLSKGCFAYMQVRFKQHDLPGWCRQLPRHFGAHHIVTDIVIFRTLCDAYLASMKYLSCIPWIYARHTHRIYVACIVCSRKCMCSLWPDTSHVGIWASMPSRKSPRPCFQTWHCWKTCKWFVLIFESNYACWT